MPYGKFKGRLLADLPRYLAWFAREGFPAGSWASCWRADARADHNNLVAS